MLSLESKIILSRRGIMLAALVGLFASSYLLYTYTTGTDLKCGALLQGCDTVRISKWASMFGIPTPFFGVIFYLSVLIVGLIRTYSSEYKIWLSRLAVIILASAGFAESLFLTYIQRFVIQQFCSWCLVSALATSLIFIFMFYDRARVISKPQSIKELKIIGISLAMFVVIGGIAFAWLIRPVPAPVISPIFLQGQIQTLEPVSSDSIYNSTETTSTIKIDDVFPKP